MIGLIVTDTHILFGEWVTTKGSYSLDVLKHIPFQKSIKEVLKSQNVIHSVLQTTLERFQFKGKDVLVAIDDDLLYHDKFNSDENLSNKEIWEYIQWETKQKWGELGNYYTTFAEKDSPNVSILHTVTSPSFLISEIKTIIANKRGNPVWAGPVSSIYLENTEYSNAVYLIDDDSFIKFYFRGRDGFSEGKLRFMSGQPTISVLVGDKDEQNKLFNTKNDVFNFVTVDLISESKNSSLRQYKPNRMIPFEGVNVKVEDVPENIPFKALNAFTILIKDFTYKYLINFFNPSQIQEKKYDGLGELDFNEKEGIAQPKAKQPDEQVNHQSTKKVKKVKKKRRRKKKNSSLLPFLLIVLLGAAIYYFFFDNNGKDLLETFKQKIGISDQVDKESSQLHFDNQFNYSKSILDTYSEIISHVSYDSILQLSINKNHGFIEYIGSDSLIADIQLFEYNTGSLDGIKIQSIEFDTEIKTSVKSNTWLDFGTIINQLQNTFQVDRIRTLDVLKVKGTSYHPIIFELNSPDEIDTILQYLNLVADNVIVRKINISNELPLDNFIATFYVAVFEPF